MNHPAAYHMLITMGDLRRILISEVAIAERVRSKHMSQQDARFYSLSSVLLGPRFNMRTFKSIDSLAEIGTYARMYLKQLGRGSSRATFALTSKRALKIAVSRAGVAQNKVELDVFTNPATRPLTMKVFDYDPDLRWLIVELVRPLESYEEFERLVGIRLYDAVCSSIFEIDRNVFVRDLDQMIRATGIIRGDLDRPEQWGVTPDNRVVLLDYGFNKDVEERFYNRPESW